MIRSGTLWTRDEENQLMTRLQQGNTITQCAIAHGRTTGAIQARQKVIARTMWDIGCTIDEILIATRLSKGVLYAVLHAYTGNPVMNERHQKVESHPDVLTEIRDLLKQLVVHLKVTPTE